MSAQVAEEIITCAEARARGLTQYFTGEPCKHGHISKKYVKNSQCAACSSLAAIRWRIKNSDHCKKVLKVWRAKNKDRVKAANLRFRMSGDNRELAIIRTQLWRDADPERAKNSRNASNARNPEKHRNHAKQRKALVRGASGSHTSNDLKQIMKMQKNKCAHCRSKFVGNCKSTLDHIIAIKNGGSNYRQNLQFLCGPCNSSKGARDPIDFARSAGRLI